MAHAADNTEQAKANLSQSHGIFENKEIDFFPIPIFETRPDEGESYGLMPVVLFTDKDSKAISVILAAIGQWNSVIKASGASLGYYYPHPVENPDEVFQFYVELAQKYYREGEVRYTNPKFLDKLYLDAHFRWLKSPFWRFYGYGAASAKSDESNFVGRSFRFDLLAGYHLTKNIRLNLREEFFTMDLLTRAFPNVSDTLTRYGNQNGVNDETNLLHHISLSYDSRPKGANSKRGLFLEAGYFASIKNLLSDTGFQGFKAEGVLLVPFLKERTITAMRFFVQDMYGDNIPFYLQSDLGGANELRSFIPNRFTDTGKMIFTWEQRINYWSPSLFGINVELYADPFIEVGRVFNHMNNLGFDNWQPVAGLGAKSCGSPQCCRST
ncbi:MAG: BamA/TamA family outer membrane protein [Deltaproteobacteria bacterium]|nr:BamA/TamA family outer membrane protein [Deltaproteobacteria bacterium]